MPEDAASSVRSHGAPKGAPSEAHDGESRPKVYKEAFVASLRKLNPLHMLRNPVMFVVEVGSAMTTLLAVAVLLVPGGEEPAFVIAVSLWLWFTVLFANFAEALAESRGKAQAEALRRMRRVTFAKRLDESAALSKVRPTKMAWTEVPSTELRRGDLFLVEANDTVPADGEVLQGAASVDESAMTGESAPVIREAGGVRDALTGGTRLLSDWLVVRVTVDPGSGFIDRVIVLIEGAKRKRTPNEVALDTLLVGFTAIFIVVCSTLWAYSSYSVDVQGSGEVVGLTVLVALLVCLAPTTIGGLKSAIGIAGIDRLVRRNVMAFSGQAVEAAGDVDVLLLDKTGTITLGNRQAVEFIPVDGERAEVVAELAQLASLADETPEGRSVMVLAKARYGLRGRDIAGGDEAPTARFIPFTAETRMSGADVGGLSIRKGAPDTMFRVVEAAGHPVSAQLREAVERVARDGGTPLVVTRDAKAVGVIHLKDVVKGGIKERLAHLRKMGIRTVMVTGDNHLTAATIAAEAGVDTFLAEATPESKLRLIREYQRDGQVVAMTGDGTNDAPALAQADVAVAMNTGTQPAREAANMVDLDSNPSKLIDIVETGKQMLMTRGALTTFSVANDLAKYFAILPAAFAATYPALESLNVMRLGSPIMSAVIFNAVIIVLLIPVALRGVRYRPLPATQLLRRNLLVWGVGGVVVPFLGIKLIDVLIVALGVSM